MDMSKPDENSKLNELAELRCQIADLKATIEKMEAGQKYFLLPDKPAHRSTLSEDIVVDVKEAFDQNPISVIITDINGNITYANPKALANTGYSKDVLIGESPRILNSGKQPKSEFKKIQGKVSSGKEWFGEFHNKKKNGEDYWESVSISPIFNNKHEIIKYLIVKEDITERKSTCRFLSRISA